MEWNGVKSTAKKTLAKYFTQIVITTNNKKQRANKKCKEFFLVWKKKIGESDKAFDTTTSSSSQTTTKYVYKTIDILNVLTCNDEIVCNKCEYEICIRTRRRRKKTLKRMKTYYFKCV